MSATFNQSTKSDSLDSPDASRRQPSKFCCCFRRSTARNDGYNFPNNRVASTTPNPNNHKVLPAPGHILKSKDKKGLKPIFKGREIDSYHLGDKNSELNNIKNSPNPNNSPNCRSSLKQKNPCLDDSTDNPFINKYQNKQDHSQTPPEKKYQNDHLAKQKFLSGVQEVPENLEGSSNLRRTESFNKSNQRSETPKKSKIMLTDSQSLIRLEQHTTFNINFKHEISDPNFDPAINITKNKNSGKNSLNQSKKPTIMRGGVKEKPNPYGRSSSKGFRKKDCPPAETLNLGTSNHTPSSDFTPKERSNSGSEYYVQQRIEEIKEEEEYYEDGSISKKSKLTKKIVTKEVSKKPPGGRSRSPSKMRTMGEFQHEDLAKSP